MGTKHIVPRAEGQGGIGTATLGWGELFITNTTNDSATQGGKLTLTSNDGDAMQSSSRLGVIEFKGAESDSALVIGARIEAICDAAWTLSENGASLKFFTTDGNANESLVLTLDSNKLAVFTGAVAINGNLTVNGTQTTVNSQTVTIDDPVFTLGGDTDHTSDDNKDRGIEFRYYSGSAKLGFFGWDDSASAFTFIADASNSGETFSGSSGNVIFGNITGTLQTAAQTNITSVGALNGGTITSGFGAINNGDSAITTTGLISGGSLDIDNVLINGTTIGHTDDTNLMTLADGVLTIAGELDAATLDISGNADIDGTLNVTETLTVDKTATSAIEIAKFKVSGTGGSTGNESFVSILPGSNNFTTQLRLNTNNTGNNFQTISNKSGVLELATTDGNPIVLKTNNSTRLTISNAGAATFSGKITADAGIDIDNFNIDGTTIALSSGDLTLDSAADIVFDAAGDNWLFKKSGATLLDIQKDQSNVEFRNLLQDGDIKFRGVDGSANITALTLDMSEAGAAIFNSALSLLSGILTIKNASGDSSGLKLFQASSDVSTISNHFAGDIAFNTANTSQKMIIKNSGNVGIGMSPSKLLDLQATDNLAIRLYNSTTFKAGIEVATTNGDMIGTSVVNDLAIRSQSNMLFSTGGNTERLRISSGGAATFNGSIALGGATIANGYLLEISTASSGNIMRSTRGSSQFSMYQANNGGVFLGTTGNNDLRFIQNNGDVLIIDTNKRVGIGNTSPNVKLDIKGVAGSPATSGTTQNGIFRIQNANNNNTLDIGQIAGSPYGTWLQAADKTSLDTTNVYPILLNPLGGNVGIGTTSPSTLLEARANTTTTDAILTLRQLGSGDSSIDFQTSTSPFGFCMGVDGSDSDSFKISTGLGNVGTNTRLTISSGGVVSIPAGIVLDSNTTGGTRTGVTLDDYEEGTWDPTPGRTGSAQPNVSAYAYRQGTYVKVGKLVTVMWDFQATITSQGSTAAISIKGLPFAVGTSIPNGGKMAGYSVVHFRSGSLYVNTTAQRSLTGFAQQGASYIYVESQKMGTDGFGSAGSVNNYLLNVSSARSTGTCTYFTNA